MNFTFDQKVISKYLDLMITDPHHRYWSWDFCFNEFSERKQAERHPISLALYLASWGMYRGSGALLQKNHRIHEDAIKIIFDVKYDDLRCSEHQEINRRLIPLILDLRDFVGAYYNSLRYIKGKENKEMSGTDTLISKILLGTTGCVPAYDQYFIAGMKASNMKKCKFDEAGLEDIFDFIAKNEQSITKAQAIAKEITNTYYPTMKIVDMYFWQLGYDRETEKKIRKKALLIPNKNTEY